MFSLPLSFARPSFLYLLILLPVLGAMAIVADPAAAGGPGPARAAGDGRRACRRCGRASRRRSRLLLFAGLVGLILAVAGPRWGKGGEAGVVVGRDLVVVLDLSRSMTAADMADPDHPQRWEAARAGVHNLVDRVQERGGHRLALVVFAARPWVVCPLTSDYDHVLARLDEFSPTAPPPEVRPGPGRAARHRHRDRGRPPRWRWPPTTRGSPATRTSCS